MHVLAPSLFLRPPTTLLLVVGLVALAVIAGYGLWRIGMERFRAGKDSCAYERRHCRYCRWGEARLTEETLRVDQDDLVETRCYTCKRCGLPAWTVLRTPVLTQMK